MGEQDLTKIHRIELFVVELNNTYGADAIVSELQNMEDRAVRVVKIESKDMEWNDDVLVNQTSATNDMWEDFFDNLGKRKMTYGCSDCTQRFETYEHFYRHKCKKK